MKRGILTILFCMLSVFCYAADNEKVIYQAWDNGAFEIYYVAAGTETAASVNISESSITLRVAGGFNPGDAGFLLNATGLNTYLLFKTSMTTWSKTASTTVPATNKAFQGTWVVNIPDDVYEDSDMTGLATTGTTACFSETNKIQLTVDASSTTVYSRYIPAMSDYKKAKIHYIIPNFTCTSPVLNIYDNDETKMHPSVSLVSGSPSYVGAQETMPTVIGKGKERLEIRITGGAITAGYMLIGYTAE